MTKKVTILQVRDYNKLGSAYLNEGFLPNMLLSTNKL
jgi:hypothetical protein